ncbi:unnamed protein product [Clonostachys rosea f. rosea IK726]|uniref:Uncharacterized protein n=2 Tax=Bionectria ochroleuca TaxID=29856 RepID=A0A0B7JUA0_BIOOC|nr:unnamed protein product [Clonostachys rosea f. rosea IK726]
MCTHTVLEYKCKHRVPRGSTRCYRDDCPGKREEVITRVDDCPQCELHVAVRSARWCPMGCCNCCRGRCTVM